MKEIKRIIVTGVALFILMKIMFNVAPPIIQNAAKTALQKK